jgi:hypothetical protein
MVHGNLIRCVWVDMSLQSMFAYDAVQSPTVQQWRNLVCRTFSHEKILITFPHEECTWTRGIRTWIGSPRWTESICIFIAPRCEAYGHSHCMDNIFCFSWISEIWVLQRMLDKILSHMWQCNSIRLRSAKSTALRQHFLDQGILSASVF